MRDVIEAVGKDAFVGFTTLEELLDGERLGFTIATIDGKAGTLASIHSSSMIRVGGTTGGRSYGVDLAFLERVAIPSARAVLESQSDNRIMVVDEIAPMQLFSDEFKAFILDVLDDRQTIFFGSVVLRSVPWVDELKSRSNVETFLLTTQNRNTLANMMADYLMRIRDRELR